MRFPSPASCPLAHTLLRVGVGMRSLTTMGRGHAGKRFEADSAGKGYG